MKRRSIIIVVAILLVLVIAIIIGNLNKSEHVDASKIKIVTSFYPIYIMTLNITNGAENIEVSNMAENFVGCIHDYTLTTTDLKKFEDAAIFIENGYDMEQFIQKIVESYPNVKIIDSSAEITRLAQEENLINQESSMQQNVAQNIVSLDKEFDLVQEDDEINPHFWTSIDNYILQVEAITDGLKELNPYNSDLFEQNKNTYIQKLQDLKNEYNSYDFGANSNDATRGTQTNDTSSENSVNERKVVSLNESFSYLFKFIGVNETLIETDHEQSSLSAETVRGVIEKVKETGIQAIVIGQNDDDQNANLIASETGAKVYRLNDAMSGDGSLDSYINTMKENLEILKTMF